MGWEEEQTSSFFRRPPPRPQRSQVCGRRQVNRDIQLNLLLSNLVRMIPTACALAEAFGLIKQPSQLTVEFADAMVRGTPLDTFRHSWLIILSFQTRELCLTAEEEATQVVLVSEGSNPRGLWRAQELIARSNNRRSSCTIGGPNLFSTGSCPLVLYFS